MRGHWKASLTLRELKRLNLHQTTAVIEAVAKTTAVRAHQTNEGSDGAGEGISIGARKSSWRLAEIPPSSRRAECYARVKCFKSPVERYGHKSLLMFHGYRVREVRLKFILECAIYSLSSLELTHIVRYYNSHVGIAEEMQITTRGILVCSISVLQLRSISTTLNEDQRTLFKSF